MSYNLLYVGCKQNGQSMYGYDDSDGYPEKSEACAAAMAPCSELPASLNPKGPQPCSGSGGSGGGPLPGPHNGGHHITPPHHVQNESFLEKGSGKAVASAIAVGGPIILAALIAWIDKF